MNKTTFIKIVSDKYKVPVSTTKDWVDAVLDTLADVISENSEVKLQGLGTFKHKDRAARIGRNAITGEPIHIPPTTIVSFSSSNTVAERVASRT